MEQKVEQQTLPWVDDGTTKPLSELDKKLQTDTKSADPKQKATNTKIKHRYKLKAKLITTPSEVKVPISASELIVITKTKDLIGYIYTVTDKAPKKFRFTIIGKLQNLSLDIMENMIRANEIMLKKDDMVAYETRHNYQKQASLSLKLLEYFAMLAYENECILFKQYEQIAKKGNAVKILLAKWMKSDRERSSSK